MVCVTTVGEIVFSWRTEEHREKTRAAVKLCRTNKHTKGKH